MLWVRDFPFHCFIYIWKKNWLEVYCSVSLLFSRCIDHFICYSCLVYIGDSLGHVICLLIYFRLAAMLLNILKCISMFILLLLTLSNILIVLLLNFNSFTTYPLVIQTTCSNEQPLWYDLNMFNNLPWFFWQTTSLIWYKYVQ